MKNQNKQIKEVKYLFEYNREIDKDTPNKIAKTKEIFTLFADYSFLNIGGSCGINTQKDTIIQFQNIYYSDINITELNYKLFLIWGGFIFIEGGILQHFKE
jgi:hypothetical protein